MTTGHADMELAILTMLQRYEVMTMDEMLTVGQPDFAWSHVFVAINRLSRQNLIALHRVGLSYHMSLMNHEWSLGQEQHHEEPAAQHR
ncbi:MAG: hypothetical protein P0120_10655 [Nitrospira sp.]|nr:hypothetical protein [Nitrospira sp.]